MNRIIKLLISIIMMYAISCSPGIISDISDGYGSAAIELRASVSDIAEVNVTVSEGNLSDPIQIPLTQTANGYSGTINNIPSGPGYTFTTEALDNSGTEIFSGSVSAVTIHPDQTAAVYILMQDTEGPDPIDFTPPVIDSLISSGTTAKPGDSLDFSVIAHDGNNETLSYFWEATSGSFSSPNTSSTVWTAPANPVVSEITITVTDESGNTNSINFSIVVQSGQAHGSAEITVEINTSPVISDFTCNPDQLFPDDSSSIIPGVLTTDLVLQAVDNEGDDISYEWSSSMTGTFSDSSSEATSWTIGAGVSYGNCVITVRVTDNRGGESVATKTIAYTPNPFIEDPEIPPSVPQNLTGNAISTTQINLSWSPSTDDEGVAGYRLYRGSTQIAELIDTNYSDTGLSPDTTYTYRVSAFDNADNQSNQSNPISVTTYSDNPPQTQVTNVHTTFGEDPTRSVVVSWRTDSGINSVVHYGLTAAYGLTANGSAIASGGGMIHHVTLTELSPGQTYHFECGNNSGWSPDSTFRTAPIAPSSFSFGVIGDVQGRSFSERWQNCTNWLSGRELQFWTPVGDLVDSGGDQAQWDAFYASGDALLRSSTIMPVLGNHDMGAGGPGLYIDLFELPGNGDANYQDYWYAFNVGDALFVILNSMVSQDRQTTWLQNILSTTTQELVFVFLHYPIYSSGGGHGGEDMLPTWNAMFEEHRVTAVFSGHCHYFETVVPIYNGQQVASYADGTLYYNTAGVNYNEVASGAWFTVNRQTESYMSLASIVTVQTDSVEITTYDFSDGSVFDNITIPR